MVTEIREAKKPSHFPKNIPEIISKGEPKPKRIIQIIENKKNENKLRYKLSPIKLFMLIWSSL